MSTIIGKKNNAADHLKNSMLLSSMPSFDKAIEKTTGGEASARNQGGGSTSACKLIKQSKSQLALTAPLQVRNITALGGGVKNNNNVNNHSGPASKYGKSMPKTRKITMQ